MSLTQTNTGQHSFPQMNKTIPVIIYASHLSFVSAAPLYSEFADSFYCAIQYRRQKKNASDFFLCAIPTATRHPTIIQLSASLMKKYIMHRCNVKHFPLNSPDWNKLVMIKPIKSLFVSLCHCNKRKCLLMIKQNVIVWLCTVVSLPENGNDYSLDFIRLSYRLKHTRPNEHHWVLLIPFCLTGRSEASVFKWITIMASLTVQSWWPSVNNSTCHLNFLLNFHFTLCSSHGIKVMLHLWRHVWVYSCWDF